MATGEAKKGKKGKDTNEAAVASGQDPIPRLRPGCLARSSTDNWSCCRLS